MTEKIGVLGKKAAQRTDVERVVVTPLPTVTANSGHSAITTTSAVTSKWHWSTAIRAPTAC